MLSFISSRQNAFVIVARRPNGKVTTNDDDDDQDNYEKLQQQKHIVKEKTNEPQMESREAKEKKLIL